MSATKLLCLCTFMLLVAVSASRAAAADPLSKANRLPASLEATVQDFQGAVSKDGYEVARGYWILWGADDCRLPLQSVGFCYGNNPTAPYVLALVPPWKNEFVDQSMKHALVQGQRGMVANYRLGEREALVIFAQMPPPAKYFGMGTNVFTRQAKVNRTDPVYVKLDTALTQDLLGIIFGASPNPGRLMMMATFGDTINNVVIDNQSAGSWGEPRFFVITPDRQMATAMTDAFEKAGIDKSLVLTEPAGFVDPADATKPQLLRLGYGPEADDFITYMRYSMPNDPVLGNEWREKLPLTILRVRDPKGGKAKDAYKIQQYEAKTWNFNESDLSGDLNNLVAAVKGYWHQEGVGTPATEFRSLTLWVDIVGQHCLGYDGPPATDPVEQIALPRGPMNCIGDNQDDEPQISGGTYPLDDGEVIAVVGTLGTETGNATYTSLSVNWFPELVGVLNADHPVLEGSAEKFKGALSDPELYKKFYVYYFARDCSGLYPFCQEVTRQLVPVGGTIKIMQRNYVVPGSTRGPEPSKVLNPFSIQFDGKGVRPTN